MQRAAIWALAAAFAAGAPAVRAGQAGQTAKKADADEAAEQQQFQEITHIEDSAKQLEALRAFVAAHPKSGFVPLAKRYILGDLVDTKAPADKIVAAADDAATTAPSDAARSMVYNSAAMSLAERGEQLDKAKAYATEALAAIPADEAEQRANVQDTLGWVLLKRGEVEPAIENLAAAAATLGDNQEVIYHLGTAYEKAGKNDLAIDTYVKSASVYLGQDTRAEAPLRALYQKQHGSLDGLDAKIAAAREASRQYVVFTSRKWDKPAPGWELKDIAGKPVKLDDFKGKLVVMDFWGSWCPPCRMELPKFQALADKYKDNKDVVFLGMNWERGDDPVVRMKKVTDFMAENHYTFPVVIDHERVAVQSYAIEGFPTVYVIDRDGTIRYRNLGYEDGVEQVIEAQLQSMMK